MASLSYTPLERLRCARPVRRIGWLVGEVAGKRVLDLGAFDETALIKQHSGYWLHAEMAKEASYVVGLDNSSKLPSEGLRTSDRSIILRGDVQDIKDIVAENDIDVVVCGELIEHLPNTLHFLSSLKGSSVLEGKVLLLTTPNATALHNVILGPFRMESQHRDHLQIYSFKTLNTLCIRAGFSSWEIRPYHVSFAEMILGSSGPMRVAARLFETAVNLGEMCFPFLSGG